MELWSAIALSVFVAIVSAYILLIATMSLDRHGSSIHLLPMGSGSGTSTRVSTEGSGKSLRGSTESLVELGSTRSLSRSMSKNRSGKADDLRIMLAKQLPREARQRSAARQA